MIEKMKTMLLIVLVALSLVQTYFLAYRMPDLGATTRSDQDYVNTELLGKTSSVESVIFPEELILHLGNQEHTILYPNTQFYDIILRQRLVNREFKNFQVVMNSDQNWDDIRSKQYGVELSFGTGVSFELLKKLLKLETEGMQDATKINRVLVYVAENSEEIRAVFFDQNGYTAYEALRVDLTVKDIQDYIGFGQYLPRYERSEDGLYIVTEPIHATELVYQYDTITPEQMQRSLFFDSSMTRAIVNRSGSQIYTDGKRGLMVEQNGLWIDYTNSTASQTNTTLLSDHVYVAVDFINQHGGWDSHYQLIGLTSENEQRHVSFRKYINQYPVIDIAPFDYAHIDVVMQQGVVMEYERTLIKLPEYTDQEMLRWLPGGKALHDELETYAKRDQVVALFPALKVILQVDEKLSFIPIWAVRLQDGTEERLMDAYPRGVTPIGSEQSDEDMNN